MHCDWLPHPGSCVPRTHRPLHRVCFADHEQFVGRRGNHWAGASCESEGLRGLSRLAHHLCTIQPWESDAPPLYSWGWLAPPWTQSNQMDAQQFAEQHPLTWVEILEQGKTMEGKRMRQTAVCDVMYSRDETEFYSMKLQVEKSIKSRDIIGTYFVFWILFKNKCVHYLLVYGLTLLMGK